MTEIKRLGLLPLRNDVFFPGAVLQLTVGRAASIALINAVQEGEIELGVLSQRDAAVESPSRDDLFDVGTYASIISVMQTNSDRFQVMVKGLSRFQLHELDSEGEFLRADVSDLELIEPSDDSLDELAATVRQQSLDYVTLRPDLPDRARTVLEGIRNPGRLADVIAAHLEIGLEPRQQVLATASIEERLKLVLRLLGEQCEELKVGSRIQQNLDDERSRHQREQYLRHKIRAIREELGDDDPDESFADKIEARLSDGVFPEAAAEAVARELSRLRAIPSQSAEYTVVRSYLEWLNAVPWNTVTEDRIDLDQANAILNRDHHGMDRPKERLVEFLAVHKLKDNMRGPILCMVGPPGVGKSSLGRAMAEAIGRKMVRISLGGVRDEAEVRGHRRTYVGALPGRIIKALRQAGSMNPLIVLDELDKLSSDFRGDPCAALLEVLDPEQNDAFVDHYLDLPVDLSQVMFVATANSLNSVPPALKDRLEIIEVSSYTSLEKQAIARKHLLPRQVDEHGLKEQDLSITNEAIGAIIERYTRESGVRQLEREIGAVCRKAAVSKIRELPSLSVDDVDLIDLLGPRKFLPETAGQNSMPGVALGLAWTSVGGAILYVETTAMPGKGKIRLTGSLGDVMKESAETAISYVRSHAGALGLQQQADKPLFEQTDLHIHFPAGGTPKDGPSAGVALLSAIVSLLRGIPIRSGLAMTGEISLRGRVLPVGGIKEKVLAAHRAGLTTILIPTLNEKDLLEVPDSVKDELTIHLIERMDEVLNFAFDHDALPTILNEPPMRNEGAQIDQ
jgi:ATP-dependent Lon protease